MISRKKAQSITNSIEKKLKEVEDEYGVCFNINKIRFSSKTINLSVNGYVVSLKDEEEALALLSGKHSVDAYDRENWKIYCKRFNLSKDLIGTEIDFYGTKAYICALKEKNIKYPIIVATLDSDKKYKISLKLLEKSIKL